MSLERFRNPVITYVTYNLTTLPGALLYFYENGSDTPKAVYQDKAGTIPHPHPVPADPSGTFPPIFLDGLYRAELKSASGVTQPNWPVDDVGTDDILVAANISSNNFSAVVTGAESPGVTWSDVDGKIRITFSPTTFRNALGINIGDLTAIQEAVDSDAAAATEAAGIATASANYYGAWSTLSGALNMPASVTHSGSVWLLLDDLADVTASEPGVSGDWFDYSGSVAGFTNPMTTAGDIIIGGSGGLPERVAKGANDTILGVNSSGTLGYQTGFCGYGTPILITSSGGHDLNTLLPPRGGSGNANAVYVWSSANLPANVPAGFNSGWMQLYTSADGANRTQIIFGRSSARCCIRSSSDSGTSWTLKEFGDVQDATANGTRYIRRNNAWETIGGITNSGITMTADRIAGRLTTDGAVQELTGSQVRGFANAAEAGAITTSGITMTADRIAGRLATNGAVQELTGAEVRTLAGAAASGSVASSGLTSATARIIGRTTAGTGALQELTAAQALALLGISSASNSAATSDRITSPSVECVKIDSFVTVSLRFGIASGGTQEFTAFFNSLLPAGYRPGTTFNVSAPVGTASGSNKILCTVSSTGQIAFSGDVSTGTSSTNIVMSFSFVV